MIEHEMFQFYTVLQCIECTDEHELILFPLKESGYVFDILPICATCLRENHGTNENLAIAKERISIYNSAFPYLRFGIPRLTLDERIQQINSVDFGF